jgi:hypothetical protein
VQELVRQVQVDTIERLRAVQSAPEIDTSFLTTPLTEYDLSQDKRKFRSVLNYREDGELDLTPSYQRESVWDDVRRQKLWKTMLQGASIGVIFLNKRAGFYNEPMYHVVDGKQRIEAYFAFLDNQLELPRLWFADRAVNAGKDTVRFIDPDGPAMIRFSDLNELGQRHAMNKPQVLICETDLATEADEARLFLTVNEGGVEQEAEVIARAESMASDEAKPARN